MELENITISEVSQVQKTKGHMFSLICEIQTQYEHKQYFEKQVTIREFTYLRRRVKKGS
jgi:hypothetical protein